ncbi:DUF1989 domain-containing protein [Streptomyces sp. GC420]|uniref:DUF1989 domain-containing protein n=1 Tax=Streptomyces sp. GC420 TaxID=2697568 RepID=UPI001414DA9B|nr:urea carboxylase-associated family protein [Streptomyces sp. GC420]NBM16170.1 DUF1989 domain-containing protein [Streptomyces sp. GC420]
MREELHRIPAGSAVAKHVPSGLSVKVVNTSGSQVVDCWAFSSSDVKEFMSMEHTRVETERVSPAVGDSLYSNRRRPVLTVLQDTSPGIHDTTLAACDVYRYERLGATGYHANCTDNLIAAMRDQGIRLDSVPCPFNLWENAAVAPDRRQVIAPPVSRPGDLIVLRAELDLIVVLSACPQDMAPTNGPDATPQDVHFAIL